MPYMDLNGGAYDVELGRLERQIVRNALNLLKEGLASAQKKDKSLGTPNDKIELHLAVIDGESGWGAGLYQKFQEQQPLTPLEASAEAAQGAARKLRSETEGMNEVFSALGFTLDTDLLANWTPEQRTEAKVWALAWTALGRDSAATPSAPETPLFLLDELRAIAIAEREMFEGAAAALCATLLDLDVHVPLDGLLARSLEELQAAQLWAAGALPVFAAWREASTDETTAALDAVENAMPDWIDAIQFEPTDVDEQAADAELATVGALAGEEAIEGTLPVDDGADDDREPPY